MRWLQFDQFSIRGIFSDLRQDLRIGFFALRASPDQIANRHDNQPRRTCLHGDAKSWYPPGGNQHGQQRGEAKERTPRSRWGKTKDWFSGALVGPAKSEMRDQDHDPDKWAAKK